MYKTHFQSETAVVLASCETGMETAWRRTAKAHFIWTCVALLVVIIASCLTYVFMSKVPTCRRMNIVNASSLFNLTTLGRNSSRQHYLFKAQGCNNDHLIWTDEWAGYRDDILDDTTKWIVIKERGVYLFYLQANFQLKFNSSLTKVDLKLNVHFDYGEKTQIFAAAHDTVVKADTVVQNDTQDANLNTFLKMYMKSNSKLSVTALPCDKVVNSSGPFSTYITLIKWSDEW